MLLTQKNILSSLGLRKGASDMEFENYLRRINSVKEIESFGQVINEKHSQFRFSLKKKIGAEQVGKSKFAQINDKGYYFCFITIFTPIPRRD